MRQTRSTSASEEVLARCLERLEAEGTGVLDALAAGHPEHADALRARVEVLREHGLLEAHVPDRVGPYRIVRLLGAGGMGSVYLAEQAAPVRRRVALKVIRPGLDTARLVARFESERSALARMNHEGIARVHEAGTTPEGRPYFVMEHVDGEAITTYCDRRRLAVRARVQLLLAVCDAVHHAHQRAILHRDLKPANVLVVEIDGKAVPKVIDFGLARALEDRETDETLTRPGQVLGTPEYMSPEQAFPDARGLDTRTDVYSLGVLLHELLVGVLPWGDAGAPRAVPSPDRAPPRPTSRLARLGDDAAGDVAARRGVSPARLYREVRGDLEWIVLQALAPEREQRYAGVSELAADLRRHLADEPVVAGPPTLRYVLGKFLRRHRALVAGGALFLAVLLGALALTGAAFGRARDHLAAFDSLADLDLLEEVRRQAAEDLWPETPGQVPRMDDWLERARGLAARLPAYESAILDLRRRRGLAVDSGWRFPRFRDELLHRSLVRLVQELRRLAGPGGEIGSVAARREWARMLRERSIEAHRATWDRAIAAIRDREASPRYEGLVLPELPGFVPIGADPRTGLWELAFPRPGEELPRRDESGRLRIDERSCLVFVLVPGGTFTLGAQRQDPDGASHDPLAFRNEAPPHSVTLDPFLISKYEMTQAQWLRATGHNPSLFHPAYDKELDVPATLTHPVERVSWLEADETLRRLGLELPTEARWEYAARAGTTWAWWTGPDQKSLAGAVNLADAHARKAGFPAQVYDHWLDDGFTVHAPVDALRPNPFGLHHVLGNVWEWCRDPSRMYGQAAPAPGDGLREGPGDPQRIFRGGSYNMPARFARCSVRHQLEPSGSSAGVGVRPCRGLAP